MAAPVIAASAAVASSVLQFKGNMASAKAARRVAEYNAQVTENEAILLQRRKVEEEANLRANSERLAATQKVATAASGIELSGSPLQALADTYFNTEMDALRIQYASEIEQTASQSAATLTRAQGRARSNAFRTQAYASLLEGGSRSAQLMDK
jgi:hypothetical protein